MKNYTNSTLTDNIISYMTGLGLMRSDHIAKSEKPGKTTVTLPRHLHDVARHAERVFEQKKFIADKTSFKKDFLHELTLAAAVHDVGKGFEVWQNAAQKETLILGEVRHELIYLHALMNQWIYEDSSGNIEKNWRKWCVIAAVAAHHGKLGFYHRHRFAQIDNFYSHKHVQLEAVKKVPGKMNNYNFDAKLFDIFKELSDKFSDDIYNWYDSAVTRYFLQLADGRASAEEEETNEINIMPFGEFEIKYPANLRELQKAVKIWDYTKSCLTLLRAPTGEGKTFAALLWGENHIKIGNATKLIFALPTRYTSNMLRDSINANHGKGNNLSLDALAGVYHSSAWFNLISNAGDKRDEHAFALSRYGMLSWARRLEFPVNVCTIDHLLGCVTLRDEDLRGAMTNLVNSAVVIDEADFYDPWLQENLMSLLRILKQFDVPVLMMSATLPTSYVSYCKEKSGYDPILKDFVSQRDVLYKTKMLSGEVSDKQLLRALREPTVIYANTVDGSKVYYNRLKALAAKHGIDREIVLYHSRMPQSYRDAKERDITRLLGVPKDNKRRIGGTVIMTQVGEMSINISCDYMITDVCPFDRLAQRLGRGARFDVSKSTLKKFVGFVRSIFGKNLPTCDVVIARPIRNGSDYYMPYAQDGGSGPVPSYTNTLAIMSKMKRLLKSDMISIVDKVYPDFGKHSQKSVDNAARLPKLFRDNWLLNPTFEEDGDSTEIKEWKARDIRGERVVFVDFPDLTVWSHVIVNGERRIYIPEEGWSAFEKYKYENMVSIYVGQFEKIKAIVAKENAGRKMQEIKIWRNKRDAQNPKAEAQIVINVLPPGFFNAETGIDA